MLDTIRKRDGRTVPFETEKITAAIWKAFEASHSAKPHETAEEIAMQVVHNLRRNEDLGVPTVEDVQDMVEAVLIENGFVRTAKSFILYRAERSRIREMNTRLMRIYDDITNKDAIESDIKRENANINGDTAMGAMLKYGSEGAKQFNMMFMMKPEHAEAHRCGDIHIHDMDFLTLTTTCCQIDLIKLFDGGFSTGHGHIRPPKDIRSYAALACIAIQANQNDQHGGQSIVNFDYAMADGVRLTFRKNYRDNLSRALELMANVENPDAAAKDVLEAVEREAGLVPTLVSDPAYKEAEAAKLTALGLSPEDAARAQDFAQRKAEQETDKATYQAMEALIHNLNTMNSRAGAQVPFSSINYGMDTSPEARMVMRNILESTQAGLGNHPETEIAYMGCRTRVMANVVHPDKAISNGRGNLSFTSINLPRLAIKSNHNLDVFFELLDNMMNLVFDQLMDRFEIQARKRVRNYPFLMGQGVWIDSENLDWDDEVREVLKDGTLSVGFIGLAECLKALIGEHHGESEKAQNLGLEIIGHMRELCDQAAARLGMNVTLLATPAEGLSGRFVKIDAKKYGVIPGVTDREYYTNSFHVPVYYDISAIDKIRTEAPYHALTNAGHISYVELDGDPTQNLEAFEKIVRVMKESGIGYGSINHPVDRDPVCGYNGIIGDTCPNCGREEGDRPFERIRRITGYLVGTLDRFNNGKRAEERDRVKHKV